MKTSPQQWNQIRAVVGQYPSSASKASLPIPFLLGLLEDLENVPPLIDLVQSLSGSIINLGETHGFDPRPYLPEGFPYMAPVDVDPGPAEDGEEIADPSPDGATPVP